VATLAQPRPRELLAALAVLAITWGLAALLILADDEKLVLAVLRLLAAVSLAAVGTLAAASIVYSRG